jgi:hypothetical protein
LVLAVLVVLVVLLEPMGQTAMIQFFQVLHLQRAAAAQVNLMVLALD